MVGRHDPKVGARDREGVLAELPIVQKLGDAEIEQLRDAAARDQDVRWLQVSMHDQVLMGVMHRAADHGEEREARLDGEAVGIAVLVDGHPVDVLHDEIGGSVGQGAAVEQVRDVGVIELREDLPLRFEPRLDRAAEGAARYDLDGDLLLELGVGALGEIHLAHAAGAQGAQHPVRSDTLTAHGAEHAPGGRRTAIAGALAGEARERV